MTRGRKPLPIEVKRRRGTLRSDRLPTPAPLYPVEPLEPLSLSGGSLAEAFDRALSEGVPWLSETDFPMVALARDGFALLERAKLAGSLRDQLLVSRFLVSTLSTLGFDPTSRARLGLAEVQAQTTLLKSLREQ